MADLQGYPRHPTCPSALHDTVRLPGALCSECARLHRLDGFRLKGIDYRRAETQLELKV